MFAEDVERAGRAAFRACCKPTATTWPRCSTCCAFCGRHGPGRLLRRAGQRSAALQRQAVRGADKTVTACGSAPHRSTCSIAAAQANWREVEPAIFGTLLERARPHRTPRPGAHHTPARLCRAPGAAHRDRALRAGPTPRPLPWCWRTKPPTCPKAQDAKLQDARAEIKSFTTSWHHSRVRPSLRQRQFCM